MATSVSNTLYHKSAHIQDQGGSKHHALTIGKSQASPKPANAIQAPEATHSKIESAEHTLTGSKSQALLGSMRNCPVQVLPPRPLSTALYECRRVGKPFLKFQLHTNGVILFKLATLCTMGR